MGIFSKIKTRYNNGSERSNKAINNIIISLFAKAISVITPLLIVPLTIDYVNPTQYGIWLTLSSIIAWANILDIGLGHGFRNKFAESVAAENYVLARKYVSTTYFIISVMMVVAILILFCINSFIDWTEILKVDSSYFSELRAVFAIVSSFFCLNMIVQVFCTLLSADQKPGISALVSGGGQLFSLIAIYILTKTSEGSLLNLAIYFSGVPCLFILLVSILSFRFTKYKNFRPSFSFVDSKLIKHIVSLGIQFFIIHICLIFIFQIINIVLSREIGPESVTQYNICQKYFGLINSVMVVITVPFWSAFTDAYCKKDFKWMKGTMRKLEICCCGALIVGIIMLAISEPVYNIWVGESVSVPFTLSLMMLVFIIAQTFEQTYMYMINGIGTIRIQLLLFLCTGIVAWPILVYSSRFWGVCGALLFPTFVYSLVAIVGKIQLNKIINGKAFGLWIK